MRLSSRCTPGAAAVVACTLALTLAAAAVASEPIRKGIDVWMTVAGRTHTSFAGEPIPAGFFCEGSNPFTGTIAFKGVPLAVTPGKGLGGIDTAVRRLDDAVFNEQGEARTRIQLIALSLASTEPIETSCGKYDVAVSLAPGEQPVTTMRIFRSEPLGGTYSAPLALNVRVTFIPVAGDRSVRRELTRRIDLGPADRSVWAYVSTPRYAEGTLIDTDGDGRPDTVLPRFSNFQAGVQPAVLKGDPAKPRFVQINPTACPDYGQSPPAGFTCPVGQCPYPTCHCSATSTNPYESSTGCTDDHLHCIWVCVDGGGGI
ncbi:MAG TPA: hypothetical protein VMW75_22890 [Thermoanaerobaculia bacterium]|nr:hypothetical protein [Thermoanaerobaculia bacterium]